MKSGGCWALCFRAVAKNTSMADRLTRGAEGWSVRFLTPVGSTRSAVRLEHILEGSSLRARPTDEWTRAAIPPQVERFAWCSKRAHQTCWVSCLPSAALVAYSDLAV